LVSELRLTAGCVLMDLASPAVSQTSVYANGLIKLQRVMCVCAQQLSQKHNHSYSFICSSPAHHPKLELTQSVSFLLLNRLHTI